MKVTITSDLHIDFWINPNDGAKKQEKLMHKLVQNLMPEEIGEVIVVAGDIGHYNTQNALMFKVLRQYFKHVLWVFGNHDLYMISGKIEKKFNKNSFNRLDDMIEQASKIDGVHYLNGTIFELDGVKIGGTGLWYDYGYAHKVWGKPLNQGMLEWTYIMNDANLIRVPNESGTPSYLDFNIFCNKEKAKLDLIIQDIDMIVTHVSPNWSRIPQKFNTPDSTFWYFDGAELLAKTNPKQIWVHGHTHDKMFYDTPDQCTIICNPLGYPPRQVDITSPKIKENAFLTVDVGNIPTYEQIFEGVDNEQAGN
jgi:predicted phosphodiesterase